MTAREDAVKLARFFLTQPTNESGRWEVTPELVRAASQHVGSRKRYEAAGKILRGEDRDTARAVWEEARNPPEKPVKRTNKQGRGVPTPNVPTRDVAKYGDHLNAIHNSRKLREYPPAQHVAYMLNREMWLKHGNDGFGRPLEFPLSHVMQQTGLGELAAGKAVKHVVESGFFRRLDNGNGGRKQSNGATYVPTLPDYSG